MTDRSAVARLGHFIATAPADHSAEAIRRSRRNILDTLGCMFLARDDETTRVALETVRGWGSGPVPVAGHDIHLPAPWAAFVNASAAHAMELDDWDEPSSVHTSAVSVPALLAILAGRGASGGDLIDAHLVAVETSMRMGEAVNMGHYDRGWQATGTIGPIAAAAGCARALKLDPGRAANAIALSTSMAAGYVSQFGTTAKPMHAGFAAKSGVFAATLAVNGATGRNSTLDGPVSFAALMSDAAKADFDRAFTKLGDPWGILEHGLYIKMVPSCGATNLVIEGALSLREAHGLTSDRIDSVRLSLPDYHAKILCYPDPKFRDQALFSAEWCLAAALVRGRVWIDEFTPEALADSAIRALLPRISVDVRPTSGRKLTFDPKDPDHVEITLKSGEVLKTAVAVPKGAPFPEISDTDAEQKYFAMALNGVEKAQAVSVRDMLRADPESWGVDDLNALLTRQLWKGIR